MKSDIKNRVCLIGFVFIIVLMMFSACKTVEEIKQERENEKKLELADKEIEIGKAVFAKLAGKYGVVKDEKATAYLNKLGKSIGLYTERQELEYFFAILDTEQINGYALPGGYIILSLGALKNIDEPGALVGILAHELGHINLKHILKHITIEVRYNFFELLARVLAGPRQVVTNMVGEISDKVEEALFMEGLSNNDEFEADFYAINLMRSFNISPESYVNYLQSLSENSDIQALETLDKTHPPLSERIEKARSLYNEGIPIMVVSDEFNEFKAIIDNLEYTEKEDGEEESESEN